MPFFETRVRVRHPCPFCDLSVDFPDARMALWCNLHREVLHVEVSDAASHDEILQAIRERLGVETMFEEDGNAFTVTRTCKCDGATSVSGVGLRLGLWILHPITLHEGWEHYRVIASTQDELREFVAGVRKLGTIEVVSHRQRARLDEVHSLDVYPAYLFDGLTDRQVRALMVAHEGGLFNVPAEGDLDELARREGLARSTFGEHLRKAQQRLFANAYPFLKLHAGAPPSRTERASRPAHDSAAGK